MEETDRRILDAAVRIFARKGYLGATTKSIAKAADVNEATLFRKFQSKENILRAVITRTRDDALKDLNSMFLADDSADLLASLRTLGRGIMQLMKEKTELTVLLISEGRKRPKVANALSSIPEAMLTRLAKYFEQKMKTGEVRKVNPQAVAMVFVSYLFFNNLVRGLVNDHVLGDSEEEFDAFIDVFTRGILRQ